MNTPNRPANPENSGSYFGNAPRRRPVLVEQFAPAVSPVSIMVGLGVVILMAAGIMFMFAGSRGDTEQAAYVPAERQSEEMTVSPDAAPIEAVSVEEQPMVEEEIVAVEDEPAVTRASEMRVEEKPTSRNPLLPEAAQSPTLSSVLAYSDGGTGVPIAETTEQILALEALQRGEVAADLSQPPEPSAETTAAIQPAASGKVAASATTWVNMRAGPSETAEVLTVVPGKAELRAETDCNWCAVTYDGREGYIYNSYIAYR